MGFFRRLFGREEKASTSLEVFREIFGGRLSRSGVTVNASTALDVTTVLACLRVRAEGIAQVPWRVYRDVNGRRTVATEHALNRLLYRRPNPWQTSFEFRETISFHADLAGNAICFVNRVGSRREIREIIPLEPHRVVVERKPDMSLTYKVQSDSGDVQEFPPDSIWHLRGPSWNSWQGLDILQKARDAIGLAIALEQGQSDFQKNGAKTSGMYSVKEKLSPEKYALLRKWFDEEIAKGDAYRPLILDQDAHYTPFTMSGVDAQLLETRRHQVEEICRVFRVMPIMIGQSDKAATYASAEQMFLAHVVHTLMPAYERIEQSADVNLLSEDDIKAGYYTKFTPNALMRGAAKDRGEFYAKALGSGGSKGWMTQNDVRELEDLDRSDDPEADKLAQPAGQAPPADPPADPPPAA
ncbi:phage portal protein [Aquabacter sp. L1I39]|uniref:phage portal protein n=1 Tax=Aquabacter sp. L1I39 TaxID=2820278 RepID=UPI001AD96124|nr:phage portal protein [Aquabacter sp. L1I39]QTL01920.1 phage portal protein [Aquabacter sp. L1I39]